MKNIIISIVIFWATSLLSTHLDQKSAATIIVNLKSNRRVSEKFIMQKLLKLIQNPNKEKLQEYLRQLDNHHLKIRILAAVDQDTKLSLLYYALAQDFPNFNTVELLLTHGSNPNKQTHGTAYTCRETPCVLPKGSTAAHIAIITHKPLEVLHLLQLHGCDFSDRFCDAHGKAPLSVAQENKNHIAINFINAMNKNCKASYSSNLHLPHSGENSPRLADLVNYEVHFIQVVPGHVPPLVNRQDDDDLCNCCCSCPLWWFTKAWRCDHND